MTSFLNSIPKKVKTSEELILSIKKAFNSIILNNWDDENDKIVVERSLMKNINEVKVILCGDSEHHDADDEKIREVCKYIQNEDVALLFIDKVDILLFDIRKDFTTIFINLVRRNLNNFVGYILENSTTIKRLTEGYMHADSAFSCGLMLRECIRHESLAKCLLSTDLVWQFFDTYVHLPNFDVASDAFNTLKELLTTPKNKQLSVEFLDLHYDKFLEKYETLLQSENYVTRRRSLKLLSELLTDRSNYSVMMRYISSKQNLKTIMNLLRNKSANIQFEAFHVFKIFVANPNKSRDIATILSQNRVKLVAYLEAFHVDRDDPQFVDEKRLLVETLRQLEDMPVSHGANNHKDMSFSSPERTERTLSGERNESPLVKGCGVMGEGKSRSVLLGDGGSCHHEQRPSTETVTTTRDTLPSQDSSAGDGISFPVMNDLRGGLEAVGEKGEAK